jgi:DNA-binding transcriptional MerR regulator
MGKALSKSRNTADKLMGAAECARRTGLTVRALRVYEREGLIKPSRSAKGWRSYGPAELERLNVIAVLKCLGLSLAQIRAVLEGTPLTLESVLRMQVDSLRSRRNMAEKALSAVEAALARVVSKQTLSIDELCALVSGLEASEGQKKHREIINQLMTPEEERAWLTWYYDTQQRRGESGRRFYEAYHALTKRFAVLFERGAKPDGPEAQALVVESNALMTTCNMREYALELEKWNSTVADKWRAIGDRIYFGDPQSDARSAGLRAFTYQAWAAAPWTARLTAILERARAFFGRKQDGRAGKPGRTASDGAAVARLVADFKALCEAYGFGDPVIFARWQAYNSRKVGRPYGMPAQEDAPAAWEWLADAA